MPIKAITFLSTKNFDLRGQSELNVNMKHTKKMGELIDVIWLRSIKLKTMDVAKKLDEAEEGKKLI